MLLCLSLSSDLHDCLILRKRYSLFTEVVAFMLLLQGKASFQCYSWLWPLLLDGWLGHSLFIPWWGSRRAEGSLGRGPARSSGVVSRF